jgi:polyisoprenoid-binding protein YceI
VRKSIFFVLFLVSSFELQAQKVEMKVRLTPVGSFVIEAPRLEGEVERKADALVARNIKLDLRHVSTGIELRDQHVREHFKVDKYPYAVLVKGVAKSGKFVGDLNVAGHTQRVSGTYSEKGSLAEFVFKVKNSDFKLAKANYMGVGVNDLVEVTAQIRVKK